MADETAMEPMSASPARMTRIAAGSPVWLRICALAPQPCSTSAMSSTLVSSRAGVEPTAIRMVTPLRSGVPFDDVGRVAPAPPLPLVPLVPPLAELQAASTRVADTAAVAAAAHRLAPRPRLIRCIRYAFHLVRVFALELASGGRGRGSGR